LNIIKINPAINLKESMMKEVWEKSNGIYINKGNGRET